MIPVLRRPHKFNREERMNKQKTRRIQPLKGKVKRCQKCKRVNESGHHLLCEDCWEKEKFKRLDNAMKEFSKRKEVNNNKAILDILNMFRSFMEPTFKKLKVIEKTNSKVKREKVWEHNMDSGDYFRVFLLDKPRLNDVDDIEVEINGVFGTTAFGIQDWEAMALIDGLNKAILKKYGSYENAVNKLTERGKIILNKEEETNNETRI